MTMRRDVAVKPKKAAKSRKIVTETYRGVQVQTISGRSKFTRDQIREAVDAAIAKNAHAFTSKS